MSRAICSALSTAVTLFLLSSSALAFEPLDDMISARFGGVVTGMNRDDAYQHSYETGAAAWLLREVVDQNAAGVLLATIKDASALNHLRSTRPPRGSRIVLPVGGGADSSAGAPVEIAGSVENIGTDWASIRFGRGNLVVVTENLTQIMDPKELHFPIGQFKVFAIKSRVHFRRGFDDSGFAKTILVVEPEQPFLGTVRLDALPYKNVDMRKFYPWGDVSFP